MSGHVDSVGLGKHSTCSQAARWWARLLGAAAVMAVVAPAGASNLYQVSVEPHVYQPLPLDGGIVTSVNTSEGSDEAFSVTNLPFPISFFGNSYSSLRMSPDGWISFNMAASNAWTPRAIPDPSNGPHNLIALWWDDQRCQPGMMKRQTLGVAPERTLVFEWTCTHNSTSNNARATYQVRFFEHSTNIEAHYKDVAEGTSASNWDTSIGIVNTNGSIGYSPVTCNPACRAPHYPSNSKITYSQPADLAVAAVQTDPVIYAGVEMNMEAAVTNRGGQIGVDVRVRFWLSRDEHLSGDDYPLGWAVETFSLDGSETGIFRLRAPAPEGLETGRYYLLAETILGGDEPEADSTNNVAAFGPLELGLPTADLEPLLIDLPVGDLVLGGQVTLSWALANKGNLEAIDVPYSIMFSRNEVISTTDVELFRGVVSLDAGAELTIENQIAIPASMLTGPYHVGVLIDPDWSLEELSKLNNTGIAEGTVSVTAPYVVILSPERLVAEASSPWTLELEANGGDGFFEWSLESGALPPGLRLDVVRDEFGRPTYTTIEGTPTATGQYSFTLRVRSAEWTELRIFAVVVAESGMMLSFVSDKLTGASYGAPYEARLLAVGGSAPYHWSLIAGALPPGLALSGTGLVSGSPEKDGIFSFDVRVVDLVGRTAEGTVQVVVGPPGELVCHTDKLPAGKVGQEIEPTQLIAAGGVAPYFFESRETRRLANGTTDVGAFFAGQPPPGLSMSADGMVSGAPKAAGRYVWAVEAMDARKDRKNCLIEMVVTYEQGPAILTTALHDGFVDTPYTVQLVQFGADEPAVWGLAPGNRLPDGLALSADGIISGMPSLTSLEGESERIFPFVVQVTDGANRLATEALSIRIYREPIRDPPKPRKVDESSCQAVGGEFSLLALAASAASAAVRRRRQEK